MGVSLGNGEVSAHQTTTTRWELCTRWADLHVSARVNQEELWGHFSSSVLCPTQCPKTFPVGKSDDEVIPRVSLMVTRRIYFRRLGLPRCFQPHFSPYTVAARLAGPEDQRAMLVPLELGYSPGNFDVVVCISQVHIK